MTLSSLPWSKSMFLKIGYGKSLYEVYNESEENALSPLIVLETIHKNTSHVEANL